MLLKCAKMLKYAIKNIKFFIKNIKNLTQDENTHNTNRRTDINLQYPVYSLSTDNWENAQHLVRLFNNLYKIN